MATSTADGRIVRILSDDEAQPRKTSRTIKGDQMMERWRELGWMSAAESGFSLASWETYRSLLIREGFAVRDETARPLERLLWIGDDSCSWQSVIDRLKPAKARRAARKSDGEEKSSV
jgi:hypothetical protein